MTGLPADTEELLRSHHAAATALLPADTLWFDAHTHMGSRDPDGFKATAEEIVGSLDDAGQQRALIFPMHEPDGYPPANDEVRDAVAVAGGRLAWLCRVDPNAGGALEEAGRCLDAGARGIKLHPRAEGFEMSHRVVEQLVSLADERGVAVLIHAGRGIPALGRDTVDLADRHPGARIILAHAGISDLGWIWREAERLPNLLFDSSWWSIADLVALFALVPPGQVLYASDAPYGFGLLGGLLFVRAALAAGLTPEAIGQIAGAQTARVLDGEELADLGRAPGIHRVRRGLHGERVVGHISTAMGRALAGGDPRESLALASLACDVPGDDPEAQELGQVVDLIEAAVRGVSGPGWRRPFTAPAVAAMTIAGTPRVLDGGFA